MLREGAKFFGEIYDGVIGNLTDDIERKYRLYKMVHDRTGLTCFLSILAVNNFFVFLGSWKT
jgi:hypothetical protein